jgi:hypothetical protein
MKGFDGTIGAAIWLSIGVGVPPNTPATQPRALLSGQGETCEERIPLVRFSDAFVLAHPVQAIAEQAHQAGLLAAVPGLLSCPCPIEQALEGYSEGAAVTKSCHRFMRMR